MCVDYSHSFLPLSISSAPRTTKQPIPPPGETEEEFRERAGAEIIHVPIGRGGTKSRRRTEPSERGKHNTLQILLVRVRVHIFLHTGPTGQSRM